MAETCHKGSLTAGTAQRCIESRACCYWNTEGMNSNVTIHSPSHLLRRAYEKADFFATVTQ